MRRRGVRDIRVLRALELVPRERFVEDRQADIAYADQALPISCGQTISQPYVVAAMTEALGIEPTHNVLEIGTGSGYQAAILAHLAGKVVSIERYKTLADVARERLKSLGLDNVTVIAADGALGAPEFAPFDRIIVTAAAPRNSAGLAGAIEGRRHPGRADRARRRRADADQAHQAGRRVEARGADGRPLRSARRRQGRSDVIHVVPAKAVPDEVGNGREPGPIITDLANSDLPVLMGPRFRRAAKSAST